MTAATKLRQAIGMKSAGCKVQGEEHLSFAGYRYQGCPVLGIKIGVNHNFIVLDSAPSVLRLVECAHGF